jgi:hypothetical protein
VQSAAWYGRFADSIFGKSTEEIAPAGIQGSNIPEPD